MYNVKYRQTDNLYEPVLFQPLETSRVSCTVFKVGSFLDFRPHLELLKYLENYIRQLEQLMDVVRNPNYKLME